ncbi:MAG: hypothetical protein M1817_002334 [Caeruleum heppii]|nr:MAG: hypothetical protein M1817_003481 [Caeruleum heppii]KAI9673696.1 MAG: hypothetical protein M1817_002334 [Caeruleum heppii]
MVRFYESHHTYSHPLPTVTLAYFLRYPNPFAKHVLSTDVIDRFVDPLTNRLHTVRLHLKRSKIPPAILKLLPASVVGPKKDGSARETYVLEKSVVDVNEGWMETETRNLEWTGVLSVVERQRYERSSERQPTPDDRTDVKTIISLHSRLGQSNFLSARRTATSTPTTSSASSTSDSSDSTPPPPKKGLFATWSTTSIQRSIELIGMRRTEGAVFKSTEGMKVVLERLRKGGLIGVLEGMRRDGEMVYGGAGGDGAFKKVWSRGGEVDDGE